jgi:hypothetical protein
MHTCLLCATLSASALVLSQSGQLAPLGPHSGQLWYSRLRDMVPLHKGQLLGRLISGQCKAKIQPWDLGEA